MKKTTVFLSAGLLAGLACSPKITRAAGQLARPSALTSAAASPAAVPAAPQAKKPQWKSREEYDAFMAFAKEKDPQKRIALVQAFIQKYPKSDFLANAYVVKMQTYYQDLGQSSKAIAAAKEALKSDPNNLDALSYLSFTFPYTFKPSDADAQTQLQHAVSNAKHGLEVLQGLQKPTGVTTEQFDAYVKSKRATFNTAEGFAALNQKNYDQAIKSLQAAAEDDPQNSLIFSSMGQAYYNSQPRDVNKAIWYFAHALDLAQEAKNPNAAQLEKFYSQVYEAQHGSNAGEAEVLAQAKGSTAPPADFGVAPPPKHASTGNQNLDAFYKIEDALLVGGDTAQQNWAQLKGQSLGLVGHVDGVEKGNDRGTYLVRVDITPDSQNKQGTYDIVLQESQPGVQYLQPGDPLRFQGTIASYVPNPNFVLTLSNAKIDETVLKAATEKAKLKEQQEKKTPVRRRRR